MLTDEKYRALFVLFNLANDRHICYEQTDYSWTMTMRIDLDHVTITVIEFCYVIEKDIKDMKNVKTIIS